MIFNFSFFISMDGVYAENRLERFQYIFHLTGHRS